MGESVILPYPPDWVLTTLGEVAASGGGNIQTGPFGSQLHASDYVEHGIPSVMPQNIGDNRITEKGIARITAEDAERLSRYLLQPGDIVYSRRGDVERRALIRPNQAGWLCGTGCLRVRLGEGPVMPEFAAYYLAHPDVRAYIVQHAVGATMPNLNTSILSSVPFLVPPRGEQEQICEILGALDDKIELNRRMNETLERQARAIFKDWFVDFGPTRAKMEGREPYLAPELWDLFPDALDDDGKPAGWELDKVEDYLELAYGKSLPAKKRRPGQVTVYGSGGLTGFHDEALIDGPAVIVGRKGTVGSLYWEDRPVFPIDTVFYVVPKRASLLFCYQMLLSQPLADMNTDAAVPGLNRNNAYRLEFPWPGSSLADAFEGIAAPLWKQRSANLRELETLAQTRDLLLPKLMSGEIRLRDAEKAVEAVA
ncbi:restriction endonuclease subunit S [Luteithermobacter gelatinilyticus]|uniref:restriction endonuclease subunit S n=1 Tax=Luteithermobacter gelatinilyticus TaxID=2582913 RepID=UPI00110593DE|nr:restriction endonuclease subunit S [Luteithermobacter gelatinilyticus]